jgi:hypothetical protein
LAALIPLSWDFAIWWDGWWLREGAGAEEEVIDAQKQIPRLQTAGQFCLAGIKKDSEDTTISEALDKIDLTGGVGKVWDFDNLAGDQVTVTKEVASGQTFIGTFDLGQIIYAIIDEAGEQATEDAPDKGAVEAIRPDQASRHLLRRGHLVAGRDCGWPDRHRPLGTC